MRFTLIRTILLAGLLLLVAGTAHAQKSQKSPCSDGPGLDCPYQWVGVTSVAFTGKGNATGFVGMTTQCRVDFGAGARMCKSEEVMDSTTLNFNAIPAEGCWIRPSWRPVSAGSSYALDETGLTQLPTNMSCGSWNLAGEDGIILTPNGGFSLQSCTVSRPVACCKPTPIPAP